MMVLCLMIYCTHIEITGKIKITGAQAGHMTVVMTSSGDTIQISYMRKTVFIRDGSVAIQIAYRRFKLPIVVR